MSITKYPARHHWSKVAKNLGLTEGLVYLKGDVLKERHDTDVELIFRQESNFYYLTGLAEHDGHVVYDIKTQKMTLLPYKLPDDHIVWMGMPPTIAELHAKYDADSIRWSTELLAAINESGASTLYVLRKEDAPEGVNLTINDEVLKDAIVTARMYKSSFEIEAMRKINHISSNAHIALMKAAKNAQSEVELDALFRYETARFGARAQAYEPIVGVGANAATLHYGRNSASFNGNHNQLCLVDAGAELGYYASDITRTFPLNGKYTGDAKTIYEIVLQMQKAVLAALKPGVQWEDMHRLASRIAVEGLQKAGVLKTEFSVEEMLEQHIDGVFFPHGLGHMIGLDVHDVGGYPKGVDRIQAPGLQYLRMRRALEPSFVVTVEPGVYFVEFILNTAKNNASISKYMNWDVVDRFAKVGGVRIEDCVVITETGIDNLTTVPKEIAEIEAIMA
ncbi:peptidase M24, structural domain-containing protein [Lobosporangium transversale]|uniref:Peptidase M24, structural domain-containing protein n=1 Tax=Lobosporangium transversale TaxID=64571 RepID=A0A1Y2G7F4_9FUNG|nr:peptidase M24, structural domain-containing protein [Lobosporangium transversale]ORY93661.1 peptidase M24, structural domain-containing protein [Lobosporangium transversale]|eukprot:XP_021875156.1 peptidase M24, structural domain-containing protein [Lobosporangium transversale]